MAFSVERCALAAAILVALTPVGASAQDSRLSDAELVGDPAAGFAIADDVCATCHAVGAGETASPVAAAPTFQTLADHPGITATALNVWLVTFHPERTMPAIVLSEEERRNVIAYMLSLAHE